MRASTFVFAFAASAFAAGVDSTDKFNDITAPVAEKAVADISWLTGNLATGGQLTYFFWRSAYLSMCFSSKCFTPFKMLVACD